MGLRTNTKKARKNIIDYIMTDSDYIQERAEYDEKNVDGEQETLAYIYEIFLDEYGWSVPRIGAQRSFSEWAAGLSMGGLFLYYYNENPFSILANVLEESEQERAEYEKKIPDDRACEILTYMIFRECRTAYEKRKEV